MTARVFTRGSPQRVPSPEIRSRAGRVSAGPPPLCSPALVSPRAPRPPCRRRRGAARYGPGSSLLPGWPLSLLSDSALGLVPRSPSPWGWPSPRAWNGVTPCPHPRAFRTARLPCGDWRPASGPRQPLGRGLEGTWAGSRAVTGVQKVLGSWGWFQRCHTTQPSPGTGLKQVKLIKSRPREDVCSSGDFWRDTWTLIRLQPGGQGPVSLKPRAQ